jgi:DNA-binding transcriptional ArsR family regulator
MDERKNQGHERHFYDEQVFVKWTHINQFIIFCDGISRSVGGGNAKLVMGQNMICIMTLLVNHMGRQNVDGLDIDEKDIAQAFWGAQSYIQRETGMSQSRVSEALSALVDSGVLVRDVEEGTTFYAFSPRTIQAAIEYSKMKYEKERARLKPGRPAVKSKIPIRDADMTHPGRGYDPSGSRMRPIRVPDMTHPGPGCAPFIEERSKDLSIEPKSESQMDGWNGGANDAPPSQPIVSDDFKPMSGKHLADFIELCKRIEWQISRGDKSFVHWPTTQDFILEKWKEKGERHLHGFEGWLQTKMSQRLANGRMFKKSAPWDARLKFCWELFLDELRCKEEELRQ